VRSGRDDNSVMAARATAEKYLTPAIEWSSRPERSVVEGPAVLTHLVPGYKTEFFRILLEK
jgi:hypothetical protein